MVGISVDIVLDCHASHSRDLFDAAKMDGASRWQQFLHVTLPGIRPTIMFMLLMTAIWSFLSFDYVWILTQGGPAGSSQLVSTHLYKEAFQRFEAAMRRLSV